MRISIYESTGFPTDADSERCGEEGDPSVFVSVGCPARAEEVFSKSNSQNVPKAGFYLS